MKKAVLSLLILLCFATLAQAATDASQHFAYIRDLYERHDKNLHDYLLAELAHFIRLYPESEQIVEAHFLAGAVYEAKGDEHQAFAGYLKTLLLYPNSARQQNCTEAILRLIAEERDFREVQEKITGRLNEPASAENVADRYLTYLQFCRSLDISKLSNRLLSDAYIFVERHHDHPHLDTVLQMIGDLHRENGDEVQSAAAYLKLDYLAPQSDILPYARFQRARLMYDELDEPDQAFALFTQVAQQHPETPFAAKSLFLTGEIKEKKHKDYSVAIVQYRLAVDTYPAGEHTVEALWRIAEINIDRLDSYAAGIGTYLEIAEKHPDDPRAIVALEEAAEIYEKKLRDYENAAKTLVQLAEKFPNHEKAPDRLFEAAEVMKDHQDDLQKTIDYFERVIEKYPDHRRAQKARDEISKLREKLENKN